MTIVSQGYVGNPASNNQQSISLFTENIELLRAHEKTILECAEYFFCDIAFASCSWPYVTGDGPLCLGYLLLGWRERLLLESCPTCVGECLVTSFSGSPLSGRQSWSGFCTNCKAMQTSKNKPVQNPLTKKIQFIVNLRKHYPQKTWQFEEQDAMQFTFGGNGLKPVKRLRKTSVELFQPVTLTELVNELKDGKIRPKNSPRTKAEIALTSNDIRLKLF
ncbi:MAG: hypothetical protein LCH63_14585 [Candidatus Melainabacteria bacterium]|nr:hypothetical protein [Candidatus Melainabacteria bacterium]